jgi:hypothetical protein
LGHFLGKVDRDSLARTTLPKKLNGLKNSFFLRVSEKADGLDLVAFGGH